MHLFVFLYKLSLFQSSFKSIRNINKNRAETVAAHIIAMSFNGHIRLNVKNVLRDYFTF